MNLEDTNKQDDLSQEENEVTVRKSLLNGVAMRAFLFTTTLGAGIIASVYFARVPISQYAVKQILGTKGVLTDVRIDKIGLKGAEFKTLKIGQSGEETIIAQNGRLVWHFDLLKRKIFIDDISARSLQANLLYDKNGLNFRDLNPLLKKSDNKKSSAAVEFNNINIKNLIINIDSQYGRFKSRGFIYGSQTKGFTAGSGIYLPAKIDNSAKPILIGINTNSLQSDKYIIGAAFLANGNNVVWDKLSAANIKANLKGNITSNKKFEDIYLNLNQGNLFFDNFNAKDININNAALNLDKIYWHSLKDYKKDAIISTIGNLNFTSASFQKNNVGKTGFKFDLSRTSAGKTRIIADLTAIDNNIAANGGISAKTLNAETTSDLIINDITKLNVSDVTSAINLNVSGVSGGVVDGLSNSLRKQNIDIGNSLAANAHFLLKKSGDKINIYLDKKFTLTDKRNTNLIYTPVNNANLVAISKKDENWISNIYASGRAQISSNIGYIDANLKQLKIAGKQAVVQLGTTTLRQVKYNGFIIDGKIEGANYIVSGNAKSGGINGRFDVASAAYKMSKSAINLNATLKNNHINAIADGNIKNFDAGSVKLSNTHAIIKSYGNLNNGKFSGLNGEINAAASQAWIADEYNLHDLNLKTPFAFIIRNKNIGLVAKNAQINADYLDSKALKAKNIGLNAALNVNIKGKNFALNSPSCLNIKMSDLSGESFSTPNAKGRICPDNKGRIAHINNGQTALYAKTYIEGSDIKTGPGESAALIHFGSLNGGFKAGRNGAIIYSGTINNIALRINGSNNAAAINAKNADVALSTNSDKTTIKGNVSGIVSQDLPAKIGGSIKTNIIIRKGKLSGDFSFKNLKIADENNEKRFSDFTASGHGNINNNRVFVQGSVSHSDSNNQIVAFYVNHDLNKGSGSADINATNLEFIPYNDGKGRPEFGVADIAPILRGVIVDAKGVVNGDARFEWAKGQKLKSTATINSDGLDFWSVPGQFYGVSGNLVFDDLLAIKTAPNQEIKIKEFNPGVPIENGSVIFSLDGDSSINVVKAEWPFADGYLRFDPAKIYLNEAEKKLIIKADDIDIAQLLKLTKIPDIEVEGRMDGNLPVYIVDNDIEIRDGTLAANGDGGVLRYVGPDFSGNQYQKPSVSEQLKEKITGKPIPQGADLAIQALRNLHYKVLSAKVSGRITGNMRFDLTIEGNNPELLSGAGFLFNVGVNAPVGGLRKFYQNAFEFDTSTLKLNDKGEYEYVPNMGQTEQ